MCEAVGNDTKIKTKTDETYLLLRHMLRDVKQMPQQSLIPLRCLAQTRQTLLLLGNYQEMHGALGAQVFEGDA